MTDEQLNFLKKIISFKSVGQDALPEAPYGAESKAVLDYFLNYASNIGFKTGIIDNKVGFVEIGEGAKMVAVLCHLDVVPVANDWDSDPFELTIKDEHFVARGIIDDKGPACASFFAMQKLDFSNLPSDVRVRLILGTDEERGCDCLMTYAQKGETPLYAITPDAEFPVIFAEKGIIHFTFTADNCDDFIFAGGTAPNAVPAKATATINGKEYESIGKAAHACHPHLGINAVTKLVSELPDSTVESSKTLSFIRDNLSSNDKILDFTDCKLTDDSGSLTLNLGIIDITPKQSKIIIDIRYPVSTNIDKLIQTISKKCSNYGLTATISTHLEPLYQDKNSPLIQELNKIWVKNMDKFSGFKEEYRDIHNSPIAIGGGTYARHLPNTVAFGPQAPWHIDQCHQTNESININDFNALTDTVYEAIITMINLCK